MAQEGPPIDWNAFDEAGVEGRFMDLLVKLPRELWAERDEYGNTLLHYACYGPNLAAVVALVQNGLVDVSARAKWGVTPAHCAAARQSRVLEVLCAAGADLRSRNNDGYAPFDCGVIEAARDGGEAARVLVANGMRLSTVRKGYQHFITPALEAFERGVLCCRAAVVAMLRVKRAGKLWMWDKFMLLGVWSLDVLFI